MPTKSLLRAALSAALALGLASAVLAQPAPAPAPVTSQFSRSAFADIPAPVDRAALPLRQPAKGEPEQWEQRAPQDQRVRNVINPTLTPVLPDPAKATGVAVIVAPGGAFRFLSMQSEGFAVARWLADRGIAAFVLKYRTARVPRDRAGYMNAMRGFLTSLPQDGRPLEPTSAAVEDGDAAIRLVRARAAEWKIDPARVGFLGFSAGAMTALGVAALPDAAARPNFIAPIYPPMMARPVSASAPPMFLAIALDDPLFAVGKPLGLIDAWRDAKSPLEVHLYETGGHGFGMRQVSASSAMWANEFLAWLRDRKIVR